MTKPVLLVEPWPYGGTAHYAVRLGAALSEVGVQPTLLAPEDFAPEHNLVSLPGPALGQSSSLRVANALRLVRWRQRFERAIVGAVEYGAYRAVHLLNPGFVTAKVASAVSLREVPLVVTVHDVSTDVKASATLARRADHILVHGPWAEKTIAAAAPHFAAKILRTPMGVFDFGQPSAPPEVLRRRFSLPDRHPVVLFFGSLRAEKGLDVLLQAVAQQRGRGQVHLFVVGARPSRSEPSLDSYQRRAEALGVGARVTWLGEFVADEVIPDIFEVADVVAVPYLSSFSGQSAVLHTARAYDRPVVVTDVAELPDFVNAFEIGLVVPPSDPTALIDGLQRVLAMPYEPNRLALQEFSWSANAAVALEAYDV